MQIAQTNTIAKIAAVVAGLGLVAMSFASFAVPAKAATTDLSSQIAALQAQLAALMAQAGGSTGSSTTFNVDLTVNSTGADVTALQNWLISKGFSIPAGATGFFGAQTKAAVAAWQASAGITPAAGYFGPKSRAAVNAMGTVSTGTGSGNSTTGLSGGSGKLKNVDTLGDVESDIHEGDSATKVIGFEATAQDSDIAVQRLDVTFTISSNVSGSSASLNRYVDTVAVYQDGKKLASMDGGAGDKNGRVWTVRFADLNGVIKEGDTSDFYVEVTPVSGIGSNEDGETITAAIPSEGIRAIDAEGVSETYTTSPSNNSQAFTISSATNGTASISEASDNPKATTVKADTSNTTDGVTLLSFNVKAKQQDITIHDLPVSITSNANNLNDYVQTVKLMSGTKVLSSKTINVATTTQSVVFDNIDQSISKDDTQNFTVVATIRKIDAAGSTFGSGDSLTATVTGSALGWDTEDTNGSTVTPTGSLGGNTITFQQTGITVVKTDASYTKTVGQNIGEGDKTQYSISFKVTAGDDDLYIGRTIAHVATPTTAPASGSGINWSTTTSSGGAGVIAPTYATNFSAADSNNADAGGYFKIPSGTSRTFTLNVTLTASSTGFTGVQLAGINYSTTTTLGNYFYTSSLDTFKTADVSMTTH